MRIANSVEKTLILGEIESKRQRGQQRMISLGIQEFEQTPGDSGGHGSLACCSPWAHKELDTANLATERQNKPLRNSNSEFCNQEHIHIIFFRILHTNPLINPPRLNS